MKKTVLLSALALAASIGATAKTADDLRVYINPGHGAWTGNDRPTTLVGHGAFSRTKTDTLSFFETNTNLEKGFGVLEALKKAGLKFDATLNQTGEDWQIGAARDMNNNIVMSRVKNGPYLEDNATTGQYNTAIESLENKLVNASEEEKETLNAQINELKTLRDVVAKRFDRNFSEMCEEVSANNFDMFISIHSNANVDGTNTNYPLFLYGGYDNLTAGSGYTTVERQTISRNLAQKCWGYAFENTHAMWTSYSATNMNIRGDLNFYATTSTSGYLGALKHNTPGFLVEGYFHTYQPARHRAMNWDVCRIEGYAYARGILDYFNIKKDGKGAIYGIVRDKYTKFKDSAYTPNATTLDAYMPINGAKVILKKDGKEVATYTTDNYYNGAYVFTDLEAGTYTVEFEHENYLALEEVQTIVVKADAVTYPTTSLVDVNWTPPTIVYENYPNTIVPGTFAADEYEFKQSYVDLAIAEIEGLSISRIIANGNNLYILAHDAAKVPTIIVYDAKNKAIVANVSTEGTQGTVSAVSDIQLTADGVLVATNENLNHYNASQVQTGETRGYNRIYRWENDKNGLPTGNPVELYKSALSGNFYRAYVGTSMAYSGTINDGKIIVTAYTATNTSSHKFYYNLYSIVDGVASGAINNKANETFLTLEKLGNNFKFTTSPLDDTKFIATSNIQSPVEFKFDDVVNGYTTMPAGIADNSYTTAFFRYNNHTYMVAADNANGINGGAKLIDITNGINNAEVISTINTSLPEAGEGCVAASVTRVLDKNDNITAAYLNLYIVRDGKLSRFTTEGVTVKATPAPLAYSLSQESTDNGYTISFKASADVDEAYLVCTNVDDNTDVVRIATSVKKGNNTIALQNSDLASGCSYNWSIELHGKTNPVSGQYFADANGLTVRGGAVVITDPEYDSFGYISIAHGNAEGIDIYEPSTEKVATRIFKSHKMFGGVGGNQIANKTNQSNPFRGNEFRGEAVFATFGDAAYGVVHINPLDLTQEPETMFAGTKQSSGAFSYNNQNLGGGCSGVCFVGEGENTKMYTFSEDHTGSANSVVRYDLGNTWLVTSAPTEIGFKSTLANANVDLLTYGNGIFASQVRNAGNNSSNNPGFIYINENGKKVYSSHILADDEYGNLNASSSGIAITRDGSTFAVLDQKNIYLYDVTWENGVPTMTYRTKFNGGSTWSHARFDYAGNLHVYERENGGYHAYAIAQEKPVVSVPAKSSLIVSGAIETTSVDDINIDTNAPATYFNMQGIAVDSNNLTPGVYIKVQGNTSSKVVVR